MDPAMSPLRLEPRTSGVVVALALYAASRAFLLVLAGAVAILDPSRSLLDVLTYWDGYWYLSIVDSGYARDVPDFSGGAAQTNLAFFPGFPVAIEAVSALTGLAPGIAGVLIATVAGGAAAAALYALAARLSEEETAIRAVALFSFFPASFVLSMLYSESLFVLLAALCLLALLERRWLAAGVTASLAATVRPVGLILALCCAVAAWRPIRRGEWKAAAAPVLAPLGAAIHVAYLTAHTGDPLAYLHAVDRGWSQRFDFGLTNLHRILEGFGGFGVAKALMVALSLLAGGAALVLVVRWRPPGPVAAYTVGILAFTLLTTATTSLPRYFLTAFPAFVAVARALPARVVPFVVAGSAGLMASLFLVTQWFRVPP